MSPAAALDTGLDVQTGGVIQLLRTELIRVRFLLYRAFDGALPRLFDVLRSFWSGHCVSPSV